MTSTRAGNGRVLKNLFFGFVSVFVLLSTAGAFYWFQLRPVKIKHDCSWVADHSNAVSAKPEWTQEQYDRCKKDEQDKYNGIIFSGLLGCQSPHPAYAAQPAKDWWRQATSKEYEFCIHEKGI